MKSSEIYFSFNCAEHIINYNKEEKGKSWGLAGGRTDTNTTTKILHQIARRARELVCVCVCACVQTGEAIREKIYDCKFQSFVEYNVWNMKAELLCLDFYCQQKWSVTNLNIIFNKTRTKGKYIQYIMYVETFILGIMVCCFLFSAAYNIDFYFLPRYKYVISYYNIESKLAVPHNLWVNIWVLLYS